MFASDTFLSAGNITNILRQVSINATTIVGMTLVMLYIPAWVLLERTPFGRCVYAIAWWGRSLRADGREGRDHPARHLHWT